MRLCCRALRTVPPLPLGAQEGPRSAQGARPLLPAVGRFCVPHASPAPPEPGAAAPPAGRGTRGQHTPFCCPTGAHVGHPGASPARLSRSRLAARRPLRRVPTRQPGLPRPPEALAGWGSSAGPPAQPREVASPRRGVLPLRGCSRDSSFPQHFPPSPPPPYRWGN